MSDILLLHPAEYGKTFGGMPPLGMASITSFLQSKNISTALVDLQISDCSVEQLLQQHKPQVVGIGGTSHTRFVSFDIARQVKKYDSAIRVIYGGPHATFTAENTLKNIPEIDYIVRGKGENITYSLAVQLLSGKPEIENIRGISCRHNDVIRRPSGSKILTFCRSRFATMMHFKNTICFLTSSIFQPHQL